MAQSVAAEITCSMGQREPKSIPSPQLRKDQAAVLPPGSTPLHEKVP